MDRDKTVAKWKCCRSIFTGAQAIRIIGNMLACMFDQSDHSWWITRMFYNLTNRPDSENLNVKAPIKAPPLSDYVMLIHNSCKIYYMNSTWIMYRTQKLLIFRNSLLEWVFCGFFSRYPDFQFLCVLSLKFLDYSQE